MLSPGVLFLLAFVAYPFFYGIFLSLQDRRVGHRRDLRRAWPTSSPSPTTRCSGRSPATRSSTWRYDGPQAGRRARHGAGDEPDVPRPQPRPRVPAAAVHRADRAVDDRLDVDPRSHLQRRQLAARPRRRHQQRLLVPGNASLAMWSLVVVNTWRGMPFYGITLLAGLQTISPDLYEAAAIDGATTTQRFLYVTLPVIKPVLIIVTMFSVIFTFGDFQLIYALTHGGPGQRHPRLLHLGLRHRHVGRPARDGRRGGAGHPAGAGRAHRRAHVLPEAGVMVGGRDLVGRAGAAAVHAAGRLRRPDAVSVLLDADHVHQARTASCTARRSCR